MTPTLWGVVNATPDSFSDGGRHDAPDAGSAHALRLAEEGAGVLDIGGESTRPGARTVPDTEEAARVLPVIGRLAGKTGARISIDTRKPAVARAAVAAGASIWNDVSALGYAPESLETAADLACDVVLMHAQGPPETMQDAPRYDDVVDEVIAFLERRMAAAAGAGVAEARIVLDPGIGFGKTVDHNVALLRNLERLVALGRPVLLGASRKRFIAALDRDGPAEERLGGSIAAAMRGAAAGCAHLRVHDVAATRQALAVRGAIAARLAT